MRSDLHLYHGMMPDTRVGMTFGHGAKRADRTHQPLDPLLVAAPLVVAAGIAYAAVRRMANRRRR